MSEAFQILGSPQEGGVLIVVDHASNLVPSDVDLGLSPDFLNDHIAYDIGTAAVAQLMTDNPEYMAVLGGVSRLVIDLNRYPDEKALIPPRSDGVEIPANNIDEQQKQIRLDRFYNPYHDQVKQLIADLNPALVLFLHSFTPNLRSGRDIDRPWEVGIMYNYYETASKLAIRFLEEENLIVGDQKPYSGKELNATINQQAEAVNQPYFAMEVRQDLISNAIGQRHFADILLRTCEKIRTGLA